MSVLTISPSLPAMSLAFTEIEGVNFMVKLVLTIPALFIAISAPIAGRLIDRYGRLKLLWVALILYAVAGSAGFFLNNLYYILFSRIVLGIAVGFSMTIVITLIADYFEGMERQRFMGLQVAFMSLGGILFLALGGILADISWRAPFLIYLFSLVVLPLAVCYLQEPEIKSVNNKGDKKPLPKPSPIFLMLVINTMLMWILFFLIPVQLPFYLGEIGVEKNTWIGIAIAVSTAFSAVSSFNYSRIKEKLSSYAIFALGYSLMALGFVLTSFAQSYIIVLIAMMFTGLGVGMMIPNTNLWVIKITPLEIRGKQIGKLTTFWFLGQFISPILFLPLYGIMSISSVFMLGAVLLLVLSITFVILHYRRPDKVAEKIEFP